MGIIDAIILIVAMYAAVAPAKSLLGSDGPGVRAMARASPRLLE